MRLLLVFNKGFDIDRTAKRFRPEPRIFHHLECRPIASRRVQDNILDETSLRAHGDRSGNAGTGLWMPDDKLIDSGRHVVKTIGAIRSRYCVVGIVHRHGPAFHKRMEAALHVKRPPAAVEIDRPDQGSPRLMLMGGMQISSVVEGVHPQR